MFEDSFTGPPRKAQAFGDNVYHFWSREWMGMCSFHPVPYSPPVSDADGCRGWNHTSDIMGPWIPWCFFLVPWWAMGFLLALPQPTTALSATPGVLLQRLSRNKRYAGGPPVAVAAMALENPPIDLGRWFSQRTKPPWLGHRDFPWQSPFDYHIYHRVTG